MTFTISKSEDCFMADLETKEINSIEELMKIIDDAVKETNESHILLVGYYNGNPHIVID